jgi:glucose/mannose-6-phosphate isomerase
MILDDVSVFRALDVRGLIAQIQSLPDQMAAAYQLGSELALEPYSGITQVAVLGQGAILDGAGLLAGYTASQVSVPFCVIRDETLPAWIKGPGALLIVLAHSRWDEFSLEAAQLARQRGANVLAMVNSQDLAAELDEMKVPAWVYPHEHLPSAAAGTIFALLHSLLMRLELLPQAGKEIAEMLHALRNVQMVLQKEVPASLNPAKRMAGQLMGRWVVVYGADYLIPVAQRWKSQLNSLAHTSAQCETVPEADHSTLSGIESPVNLLSRLMVLFLRAQDLTERNGLRLDLTREMYLQQGINTDFINARGDTRLSHLWTTVLFGDYTAYYLAMANGVDPSAAPAVEAFEAEMAILTHTRKS